ncbi:MAG TPA: dynamin family protein [Thermodesulfobacteriota bacterium]|nr:dynamin family protein [Thermodesulfobacteriota bacterium]
MLVDAISPYADQLARTLECIKGSDEWGLVEEKENRRLVKLVELFIEEISSRRKSIYLAGKTSSGKSSFLNYILDSRGLKVIPETCRTETRRILRLRHSAGKKAFLKLCPTSTLQESFKKEFEPPGGAAFDEKSGSIEIPLESEDGVKLFQRLIQAHQETHYDPVAHIDYIDLFYPVRYFRDYVIYDTPGLASWKSETDEEVTVRMFNHSLILWMLIGNEPNLTETLKVLDDNHHLTREIEKERLVFISNFFDQLDKRCRDHGLLDPEAVIREKFSSRAKEMAVEFSGFYFSVFQNQENGYLRYRKLTERTLLEIERHLAENGRKIHLLNFGNASDKLIQMLEVFQPSLSRRKKELRKGVDASESRLKVLEEGRRKRMASLPALKDIVSFDDLREEIERLCEEISGIKSNDRYNRSIKDLADTAFGLPDKLRSRIEKSVLKPEEKASLSASLFQDEEVRDKILDLRVNPLWSNIKDFWHAGVKKELKGSFTKGLSSAAIAPLKDYIEALDHSVEEQFVELKEDWEKKITEESETKKELEMEGIHRAEAELQKITLFEKEILKSTSAVTQMDHHLRQDFQKALRGWKEPKGDGTDVKLKKFLELWGILKNLEYTNH